MTRRIAAVTIASVALVALGFLVVRPPAQISGRAVSFALLRSIATNRTSSSCSVLISNMSECPVMFAGGFNRAWLEIDYLSASGRCSVVGRTPGGGNRILLPHQTLTTGLEIPQGAMQLRVGLAVTSLTWRGRLAWRLAGSRGGKFLRPLIGALLGRDEKRRSRMEWSIDYRLPKGASEESGA